MQKTVYEKKRVTSADTRESFKIEMLSKFELVRSECRVNAQFPRGAETDWGDACAYSAQPQTR